MKLQIVAPGQGVAWVRRGFQVFVRQPLGFAALFAACLFVFIVLRLIPMVGPLALAIAAPAGSLLFMIASRLVSEGKRPMPTAVLELGRAPRPRLLDLLKLGLAYLAAAAAIYFLSVTISGGTFGALVETMPDGKPTPDAIAHMSSARMQLGLLSWLLLVGLLAVPFWHAPALVHWGGQGWAKSLFFSTVGIWRNRGAFTVYGLAWTALSIGFMMASGLGIALLGPQVFAFVGTPAMLALVTAFYASLYFTFADCFSAPDTLQETPA